MSFKVDVSNMEEGFHLGKAAGRVTENGHFESRTSDQKSAENGQKGLVLSLFPGIDLLGRGFEAEGFCVVRGPDLIFGGDIREFFPPSGVFAGIIGGSPCQDFSKARRCAPTGYGVEMLAEFARCVTEARPDWFLLENVPCVPSIVPMLEKRSMSHGYSVQRLDFNALESGLSQDRHRHIQFGSLDGSVISPRRLAPGPVTEATCTASSDGRPFSELCRLQGLPDGFDLPSFTMAGKKRAVGNGVPLAMARELSWAVTHRRQEWFGGSLCECGCGRTLDTHRSGARQATAACRKRMQRRRVTERQSPCK